jgi:hypothetical protein
MLNFENSSNPFSQSQARVFTDDRIVKEFQPTPRFWSLFNEEHEILVGARGSGKTHLLRMMRYSLLRRLDHEIAKKRCQELDFLAIFAPTNLEFLDSFSEFKNDKFGKTKYFQFGYNCLIAVNFLEEIKSLIKDQVDGEFEQDLAAKTIAERIASAWIGGAPRAITRISQIQQYIQTLYGTFSSANPNFDRDHTTQLFSKQIGSMLATSGPVVAEVLKLKKEPKWIICIDEAEFLEADLQMIINSLMRSSTTGNFTIKMATLPFHHQTLSTSVSSAPLSPTGDDFKYVPIDLDFDSEEFRRFAEQICVNRLNCAGNPLGIAALSEIIEIIGGDNQIDYFANCVGKLDAQRNAIERGIISQRPKAAMASTSAEKIGSSSTRKTIYDKYAPIYFTRKMKLLSQKGNTTPGWYAGASMLYKLSQGNPRRLIQLLYSLFEIRLAGKIVSVKDQHRALFDFSQRLVDSSLALPKFGPALNKLLKQVAEYMSFETHGDEIKYIGSSFRLGNISGETKEIIKLGAAFQYLICDCQSAALIGEDTEIEFANIVCAAYWIPMRKGDPKKFLIGELPRDYTKKQFSLLGDI